MKQNKANQILLVLLGMVFILACSGGGVLATETPVPTNTVVPTNTPTLVPEPTATLEPTATVMPTPAPVGFPVQSESYEVTVLKTRRLDSGVHTGDGYYWTANPGNVFVELEVKVTNLNSGTTVSVPWSHVFVVESEGKSWYPNWGGAKAVASGKNFSPSSLSVSSIKDGDVTISFKEDLYLRAIYVVAEGDPTTVWFGFEDSPPIEVVVEKKP
jgi:hypothetical protein